MGRKTVIRVEEAGYAYPGGVRALRSVSLEVVEGEFIALMGHNGSGKTTLAKLMNGLLKPTEGRVLVGGRDTRSLSVAECARTVGYVFQNPEHQIFAPTLYDEVAFGPRNLGLPEDEVRRRVMEALEIVDLGKPLDSLPHLFSVGEKHRVAIASVLAMRPKVLILDEPTTGIDFGRSLQIMRILKKLNKEQGVTIILITHDLYLAAEYTDRTVILNRGEVVADGPTGRVLSDTNLLASNGLSPLQVTLLARRLGLGPGGDGVVKTMQLVELLEEALKTGGRLRK